MSQHSLLEQLSSAASQRPFTAAEVGTALQAQVAVDAQASNKFFTVHRGPSALEGVRSVEVRSSVDGSKGGVLLVELDGCLKKADIGDHFGPVTPQPPSPPSPRAPADSPAYDLVSVSWGQVRLGYRPSDGCLVSVVFDAT